MILHTQCYTFFDGLKSGQLLLHSIKAFLKDLFHCSSVYIHLMDPKCRTFHLWEHHEYVHSDIQHKGDLFIRLRPWNRWYMSHMLLVVRPNAFYAHTSLKSSAQHVVRQQTVSLCSGFPSCFTSALRLAAYITAFGEQKRAMKRLAHQHQHTPLMEKRSEYHS